MIRRLRLAPASAALAMPEAVAAWLQVGVQDELLADHDLEVGS